MALIIFLFHSRVHLQCDYGILNYFVEKGNIVAMTAFFMLSGYSLVISNGSKDYRDFKDVLFFLQKRFISIYPLYLVAGYLGVVMYIFVGQQSIADNIVLLPVELLCIQSFFDTLFPFAHNAGSWFISCLVFCFFLFPWLIILLQRINRKRKIFLLISLILLLAYFPYVVVRFHTSTIYSNPFFRLLEFCAGMIIAMTNCKELNTSVIMRFLQNKKVFYLSVLLLIVGISVCSKFQIYLDWLPITFITIILYGAGSIHFPILLNNEYILYLSSVSYAFFLGQKFVWLPTKVILNHTAISIGNLFIILFTFLSCLITAVLLHEYIEKNASKWLRPLLLKEK